MGCSADTKLYKKGTQNGLTSDYDLSNGIDIKINVGISGGIDAPQVLAHELLVHGIEGFDKINTLKTLTRGTSTYNSKFNCLSQQGAVSDHGKMVKNLTINYKNACYELQQKFPISWKSSEQSLNQYTGYVAQYYQDLFEHESYRIYYPCN